MNAPVLKRRLCFDFDGVIHSYASGWRGATEIPDPPVAGMADAIRRLMSLGWDVVVQSSRCNQPGGTEAIQGWLATNDFPKMLVTATKLPAEIYIDDRALRFDGCVPALLEAIDSWEGPWNLGAQAPAAE